MNNVQAFLFANLLTGVSQGKGIIPFFIFKQTYVKILDFYTGRDKNQDRFEMGLPYTQVSLPAYIVVLVYID